MCRRKLSGSCVVAGLECHQRVRGSQLAREEAVSAAQVTDGEAWIKAVAAGWG